MPYDQGSGYHQTITIKISPVVLGHDSELLAATWASVGGRGPVPCANANPYDNTNNLIIQEDAAGFAFGTISITNDTPEFTPKSVNYDLAGNDLQYTGIGGLLSDGADCKSAVGLIWNPTWGSGDSWGPLSFDIAIPNVRTPAAPNGDANLVQKTAFGLFDPVSQRIPLTLYQAGG